VREKQAAPRSKGESPSQRIDEQPQVAGIADYTIDTSRDRCVTGLDGHQPAEPSAEHKDRPDPQYTIGSEENDSKPRCSYEGRAFHWDYEMHGLEKGICEYLTVLASLHLLWQRTSLDSIAQRDARLHFPQGLHDGLHQPNKIARSDRQAFTKQAIRRDPQHKENREPKKASVQALILPSVTTYYVNFATWLYRKYKGQILYISIFLTQEE
jgi:hypothetical protein